MPNRHHFQGLLHTGRPSDTEFRVRWGLKPLPITTRVMYDGWSDGNQLPPEIWYDNVAAALDPPDGWVLIDHEMWPTTTQAERLLTAGMFATVFQEMKSRRPDLKFGFYSYAPRRDLFNAIKAIDHADYLAWQATNDDMAEMAACVDGFFPSIYYFYDTVTNGAEYISWAPLYYERNILEARRIRDLYGDKERPVYPYIWYMRQDGSKLLDSVTWEQMIDSANTFADGYVLWGGWDVGDGAATTWLADARDAAWWHTLKTRLPRRFHIGACV